MQAIILAGGKGTRLRPYTTTLPKPLVPVGDHPIVSIVIRRLRAAGVTKVTMAVSHMAELIMSFYGKGEKLGVEIAYSLEDRPLGTVGPVKLISGLPEDFLVMNGDILTDLNYRELYDAHIASGAKLTVATYQRDAAIDFGVLEVEAGSNRVSGFREKPVYHFNVSAGIYVFNRSLLDRVERNQPYGFDTLVLDMLSRGEAINAFPHRGYWLDLGRPDDYDRANQDIKNLFPEDPSNELEIAAHRA